MQARVDHLLERLGMTGSMNGQELMLVHLDGTEHPVLLTAQKVNDEEGNALCYVASMMDITELRAAQAQLRFVCHGVDRAEDAAFWMDESGRYVYVNDAACRRIGLSREELLLMSVEDAAPFRLNESWPDFWRRMAAEGALTLETEQVTREGRKLLVEVTANYEKFNEFHMFVRSRET